MFKWMKRFFRKKDNKNKQKVVKLEGVEELARLDLNDTQIMRIFETSNGVRQKIRAVRDALEVQIREKENPTIV